MQTNYDLSLKKKKFHRSTKFGYGGATFEQSCVSPKTAV